MLIFVTCQKKFQIWSFPAIICNKVGEVQAGGISSKKSNLLSCTHNYNIVSRIKENNKELSEWEAPEPLLSVVTLALNKTTKPDSKSWEPAVPP